MFTVYIRNEVLGRAHYCGTFDTVTEAQEYANQEASRTRNFVTYEVHTGTAKNPGNAIDGTRVRGEH